MRVRIYLLALAMMLAATGCRKHKPIPLPFRPPPEKPPVVAESPEIPPPPELLVEAWQETAIMALALQLPPLVAPPKPRPVPTPPPGQVQAPPAFPVPQLRPILTPAETQELERTISARISRAEGVLKSIAGRRLSAQQTAVSTQVRTFIRQAEEARKTDLLRANNLAERAEVLASDLAAQLR